MATYKICLSFWEQNQSSQYRFYVNTSNYISYTKRKYIPYQININCKTDSTVSCKWLKIMETFFVVCVTLFMNFDTAAAFFPHAVPGDDYSGTRTHYGITSIGLLRVIERYIVERKNSTSTADFFGQGKVYAIFC